MKFLIVGGSGPIGYSLATYLNKIDNDVQHTYLTHATPLKNGHVLDITNKDKVEKLISKHKPEILIHAVSLPGVDKNELEQKLAYSINVKGTENIIDSCKKIGSKIIYVSTSYVFDGSKKIYSEDDDPNPVSYYGKTKMLAENLVRDSSLDHLILRTDQPYCWIESWQRVNSVVRVVNTLRTHKALSEVIDWYNQPTYILDFVNATDMLIKRNERGIFHVVGSDFVNRYNWSLKVADVFGLDKNLINPIQSESLKLSVKRVNINISNKKLCEKIRIKMCGVEEGARLMLESESK